MAGFTGYGFATRSPSTIGYVSSVLVIAAAVVALRRAVLPPLLAAGLASAAIVTLAGGLIRVGHDVLTTRTPARTARRWAPTTCSTTTSRTPT